MDVTTIVDALLDDLYGRSGFDAWWDTIDPEVQGEIREELARKLEALL